MPLPNFSETTKDSFDNKNPLTIDSESNIAGMGGDVPFKADAQPTDTQVDSSFPNKDFYNTYSNDPKLGVAGLKQGEFSAPGVGGNAADQVAKINQRVQQFEQIKPAATIQEAIASPDKQYTPKSYAEAVILQQARTDAGIYKQTVTAQAKSQKDATDYGNNLVRQANSAPIDNFQSSAVAATLSQSPKMLEAATTALAPSYNAFSNQYNTAIKNQMDELIKSKPHGDWAYLDQTEAQDNAAVESAKKTKFSTVGSITSERIKHREEVSAWRDKMQNLIGQQGTISAKFMQTPEFKSFVSAYEATTKIAETQDSMGSTVALKGVYDAKVNSARNAQAAQAAGAPVDPRDKVNMSAGGDGATMEPILKRDKSIIDMYGDAQLTKSNDRLNELIMQTPEVVHSKQDELNRAGVGFIGPKGTNVLNSLVLGDTSANDEKINASGLSNEEKTAVRLHYAATEKNALVKDIQNRLASVNQKIHDSLIETMDAVQAQTNAGSGPLFTWASSPNRLTSAVAEGQKPDVINSLVFGTVANKTGIDETAVKASLYGMGYDVNGRLAKLNTSFDNVMRDAGAKMKAQENQFQMYDQPNSNSFRTDSPIKESRMYAEILDDKGGIKTLSASEIMQMSQALSKVSADDSTSGFEAAGIKVIPGVSNDPQRTKLYTLQIPATSQFMIDRLPFPTQFGDAPKESRAAVINAALITGDPNIYVNGGKNRSYLDKYIVSDGDVSKMIDIDPSDKLNIGKRVLKPEIQDIIDHSPLSSAWNTSGKEGRALRAMAVYAAGERMLLNDSIAMQQQKSRLYGTWNNMVKNVLVQDQADGSGKKLIKLYGDMKLASEGKLGDNPSVSEFRYKSVIDRFGTDMIDEIDRLVKAQNDPEQLLANVKENIQQVFTTYREMSETRKRLNDAGQSVNTFDGRSADLTNEMFLDIARKVDNRYGFNIASQNANTLRPAQHPLGGPIVPYVNK